MLTVKEVYEAVNGFAPFASQESWDNSGLLVGSMTQPADRILTTLDISEEVIAQAVQQQRFQRRENHRMVRHNKLHLLAEPLALENAQSVLEPSWTDGRGFGWIDTSTRTWTPQALAQVLEKTFGTVRYSAKETPIRKIAYCSGSAASMLELACLRFAGSRFT